MRGFGKFREVEMDSFLAVAGGADDGREELDARHFVARLFGCLALRALDRIFARFESSGDHLYQRLFRKAAEEALIEAIAGGLEPGEDPIEGARRETAEETGYEVTSIKFLTTIICTPGYCEERIHLYFAEISDTAHAQDQDPDENVYPVILSEAEVEDGIRNGTIFDSKTLSAWLCWKLAR